MKSGKLVYKKPLPVDYSGNNEVDFNEGEQNDLDRSIKKKKLSIPDDRDNIYPVPKKLITRGSGNNKERE